MTFWNPKLLRTPSIRRHILRKARGCHFHKSFTKTLNQDIRKVLCVNVEPIKIKQIQDNLKIPLPTIHTTSWSWGECERVHEGGKLDISMASLMVFFHLGVETHTDDSTCRTAHCFAGRYHLKLSVENYSKGLKVYRIFWMNCIFSEFEWKLEI